MLLAHGREESKCGHAAGPSSATLGAVTCCSEGRKTWGSSRLSSWRLKQQEWAWPSRDFHHQSPASSQPQPAAQSRTACMASFLPAS
jgi:hypothetical protein